MKKILKGLLFAFVAVLGLTLASCEETPQGHQHELKSVDTWQRDSATHWQECKTCDEYVNMAVHKYAAWQQIPGKCVEQRACVVCSYIQKRDIEHTWTDWTTQEDGSLGRSCTVCKVTEGVTQYYLKGSINEWSTNADYALVLDPETMTASITVTFAAGDEFKVTLADSWDVQFNIGNVVAAEGLLDGTDNIIIKEAADYKITVSGLAGSSHTCTVEQLCVHTYDWTVQAGKTCDYDGVCSKCQVTTTKVEHAYGEWVNTPNKCEQTATCSGCQDVKTQEVEHIFADGVCSNCGAYDIVQFYLKGDMNSWSDNDAYKLSYNKDADTASIVLYIAAGQGFKVADSSWANQFGMKDGALVANDGGSGNITVETSGSYVITVTNLNTPEVACTIEPASAE